MQLHKNANYLMAIFYIQLDNNSSVNNKFHKINKNMLNTAESVVC